MTSYWTNKKRPDQTGSQNSRWIGDKISYRGLHLWVERFKGIPDTCEFCGGKPPKKVRRRIHWANKSGKYKRDLNDWIALCVPCHRLMDYAKLTNKKHE